MKPKQLSSSLPRLWGASGMLLAPIGGPGAPAGDLRAFDSIVRDTRTKLARLVLQSLNHGLPADEVDAALREVTDGLAALADDLKS